MDTKAPWIGRTRIFDDATFGNVGAAEEEQVDVPSKDVRIEVPEASVDDLLDFQEQLSQIPGVSITLIQGLRKGGVSFLVRLDSENEDPYEDGSSLESQPRVVCMFCGKAISDGNRGSLTWTLSRLRAGVSQGRDPALAI